MVLFGNCLSFHIWHIDIVQNLIDLFLSWTTVYIINILIITCTCSFLTRMKYVVMVERVVILCSMTSKKINNYINVRQVQTGEDIIIYQSINISIFILSFFRGIVVSVSYFMSHASHYLMETKNISCKRTYSWLVGLSSCYLDINDTWKVSRSPWVFLCHYWNNPTNLKHGEVLTIFHNFEER